MSRVVSVCVSLMVSDLEHLCLCLWTFFGEVSVQTLCAFLITLFIFLLFYSGHCTLATCDLQIFRVCCLFTFLGVFAAAKAFTLEEAPFIYFFFDCACFGFRI